MTTIESDLIQEQYIIDGNGNKTAVILSIAIRANVRKYS